MFLSIIIEYNDWFSLNKKLENIALKYQKEHERKDKNFSSSFEFVTYFLFIKSYYTFKTINFLVKRGYGFDAAILERSLIENLVDMIYISKDPITRSDKFLRWEAVETKKLGDSINNNPDWMSIPSIKKSIEETRNKVETDYNKYEGEFPEEFKGWSQKSITKRIKESHPSLEPVYSLLSNLVHPSVSAVRSYFKDFNNKKIISTIYPNKDYISEIVPSSHDIFFDCVGKFQEVFKIENSNLENIKKRKEKLIIQLDKKSS